MKETLDALTNFFMLDVKTAVKRIHATLYSIHEAGFLLEIEVQNFLRQVLRSLPFTAGNPSQA